MNLEVDLNYRVHIQHTVPSIQYYIHYTPSMFHPRSKILTYDEYILIEYFKRWVMWI